ncbi:MAG: 2'-5' RNA ligase family protein [Mycobacterium sp.]
MAHSIELLLDNRGDGVIRGQWQALADAGLPSQLRVRSDTNRPHVTLIAAGRIGPGADEALRGLAGRFPLDCAVGAPLVFGGPRYTLARLVVPSAGLLALHECVYRLALPHLAGEPFAHCRPGRWTPHVTLGRRFSAEQIGSAMAVVNAGDDPAGPDLAAMAAGLRRWDGDERVDHLLIG